MIILFICLGIVVTSGSLTGWWHADGDSARIYMQEYKSLILDGYFETPGGLSFVLNGVYGNLIDIGNTTNKLLSFSVLWQNDIIMNNLIQSWNGLYYRFSTLKFFFRPN